MAEKTLKHQAISSLFWKIIETGGTQIIQFIISVFLARLVMPEQFASIALLSIFLAVSRVFINGGLTSALIRKKDRTQTDCCTVFYFNIFVSLICYIIIYLIAPLVAKFYDLPELTILMRIMGLTIIITSFSAIHTTLFTANLNFKAITKYNIASMFISGVAGIYLAYLGWQVWALVAQALIGVVITTGFMWYCSHWRPSLLFSWKSFKEFFGFGSKLLVSSLIDTIYVNIYGVVIGKVFVKSDLAFFNRAQSLNVLTSSTPTSVLASVTYPTLCKIQDDDDRLREGYRKMICLSAFVIFPLSLGLGAVSYPLINVLYTNIWIYAASLLQILVFAGMWYPIHAINLNLLIVKGRSDIFLRLEIIKKIIGVSIMIGTVPLGIEAMCYGTIVSSLISLLINTYYTGKLINMGIIKQLKDIYHILILSLIMFASCKLISTILGNGIQSLVISVLCGIIIYFGGAVIFKFKELPMLLNIHK